MIFVKKAIFAILLLSHHNTIHSLSPLCVSSYKHYKFLIITWAQNCSFTVNKNHATTTCTFKAVNLIMIILYLPVQLYYSPEKGFILNLLFKESEDPAQPLCISLILSCRFVKCHIIVIEVTLFFHSPQYTFSLQMATTHGNTETKECLPWKFTLYPANIFLFYFSVSHLTF